MSSSATVAGAPGRGRAAVPRGRAPRSDRGSSAPWLNASALRARAGLARDPAADHHREQPRIAAGVGEQDPVGAKNLATGVCGSGNHAAARPSATPAAPRTSSAAGRWVRAVKLLLHALARPAGLAEDPPVLGTDHQHRVPGESLARATRRARARPRATQPAPRARARAGRAPGAGPRPRTASRRSLPRSSPARACASPGHGAVSSRRSANANPTLPGWPWAARSSRPGRPPPTLRTVSCSARPIVELARFPWPNALTAEFIPARCDVRTADDDHRTGRRGRRDQSVQRELLPARGLDRREHDRQLGPGASRHHRVDRDLLDRRAAAVGRHDADQLLRIARGVVEHRDHALGRRRHDRQAVGQPALVHRLERVLEPAELELARRDPRPRLGPGCAARRAATSGSRVRDAQPGRIAGRPSTSSVAPAWADQRARADRGRARSRARARRRPRAGTPPGPRRGQSARRARAQRRSRAPARATAAAPGAAVCSSLDCETSRAPAASSAGSS